MIYILIVLVWLFFIEVFLLGCVGWCDLCCKLVDFVCCYFTLGLLLGGLGGFAPLICCYDLGCLIVVVVR